MMLEDKNICLLLSKPSKCIQLFLSQMTEQAKAQQNAHYKSLLALPIMEKVEYR